MSMSLRQASQTRWVIVAPSAEARSCEASETGSMAPHNARTAFQLSAAPPCPSGVSDRTSSSSRAVSLPGSRKTRFMA